MIGKRELKSYVRSELPKPEPHYLHQTFSPITDTVSCVEFDMRFASKNAHMSTTMFLERTFKIEPRTTHPYQRYWNNEESTVIASRTARFAVKPGFLLQQNCENFFMNYNSSSDRNMNPNIWLRPYSQLYKDQLENLCRGSGRVIESNQQADTHCENILYFTSRALSIEHTQTYTDMNLKSVYAFPDRIERRMQENFETAHHGNADFLQFIPVQFAQSVYSPYGHDPNTYNVRLQSVYPAGHENAGQPQVDGEGNPVYFNELMNLRQNSLDAETPGVIYRQLAATSDADNTLAQLLMDAINVSYDGEFLILDVKDNDFDQFKDLLPQIFPTQDAINVHYSTLIHNGTIPAPAHGPLLDEHGNQQHFTNGENNATGHPIQIVLFQPQGELAFKDEFGWEVDLRHPFVTMSTNTANPLAFSEHGENHDLPVMNFLPKSCAIAYQFMYEVQKFYFERTDDLFYQVNQELKLATKYLSIMESVRDGAIFKLYQQLLADAIHIATIDPEDDITTHAERVAFENLKKKHAAEKQQFHDMTGMTWVYGEDTVDDYYDSIEAKFDAIMDTYDTYFGSATMFATDNLPQFDDPLEYYKTNLARYEAMSRDLENFEWLPKMREIMAWHSKLDPQLPIRKVEYDREITIIEPLMCSTMRPTEYRDIGCWSKNSNVFPYIERFKLRMDFQKDQDYFELDSFVTSDIVYDRVRRIAYAPKMMIKSCSSKLHCTFVAHPCSLPSVLNTLHFEVHKLASFTMTKGQSQTINFQDIEYRNSIQQLLFFCKTDKTDQRLHNRGSASIVALQLRTDVSNQNINLISRHHCDAVTTRNFPQYKPPTGVTGNVVALTYNELPRQREVLTEYNHLHGKLSIQNELLGDTEQSVYCVIIYKDTFLQIENHYALKNRDLLY